MSNSNSSPAHSSISTTAIAGERERSNSNPAAAAALSDDLFFPSDLISIQDRKHEALLVIKSDLMDALHKVVKSLEEDNWMFEGPRHRVIPISRQVKWLCMFFGCPYIRTFHVESFPFPDPMPVATFVLRSSKQNTT